MKRFVHKAKDYEHGFEIEGDEFHHLARVARVSVGENVCCGSGAYDYIYKVTNITKKSLTLCFERKEINTANPLPVRCLTVFVPLIALDKLSLTVQKLNEIGAGRIILFRSANCNISPKAVNTEKLENIAEQSCKQCGRSIPIELGLNIVDINGIPQYLKNTQQIIFADENEKNVLLGSVTFDNKKETALIIGPEGGFTAKERELLRNVPNITAVSLGNRILRAETAAIAAGAVILSKIGEI